MVVLYIVTVLVSLILLVFAGNIADTSRLERLMSGSGKYISKIEFLYPKNVVEKKKRTHLVKNVRYFLIILAFSGSLALLSNVIGSETDRDLQQYVIKRPGYEDGNSSLSLRIMTKSGKDLCEMPLQIDGQKYTNEKLDEYALSLSEYLRTVILNNNESSMRVVSDLKLPDSAKGNPLSISWHSNRPEIISDSGEILDFQTNDEETAKEEVTLTAIYSYDDYCAEDKFELTVVKPALIGKDRLVRDIQTAIDDVLSNTANRERIILPKEIDGIEVTYKETGERTDIVILALGVIIAFLTRSVRDRKIDEKLKERNEQMLIDYPKIVNRYVLYYSAGLNTRSVWKLICEDYQSRNTGGMRYAFEEMITAYRAMGEGMSELKAYEMFAGRCGLSKYKTFVNLIEQLVSNGNEQISDLLEEEVNRAGKERVNRAKISGEKAATKLLLPMFMMLLCVITIVIVPAFVGMAG